MITREREAEHARLAAEIEILKRNIDRKKTELAKARLRLRIYKKKMQTMKVTIAYQRCRILQLYRGEVNPLES
jgi:hypothetical protein